MHYIAKLHEGAIYSKWMKLNRCGGVIKRIPFRIVNRARDAYFITDELDNIDSLKDVPNIVIAAYGVSLPKAERVKDIFAPEPVKEPVKQSAKPEPVKEPEPVEEPISEEDDIVTKPKRGRPPKVKDE
jgi:hypothetical protein